MKNLLYIAAILLATSCMKEDMMAQEVIYITPEAIIETKQETATVTITTTTVDKTETVTETTVYTATTSTVVPEWVDIRGNGSVTATLFKEGEWLVTATPHEGNSFVGFGPDIYNEENYTSWEGTQSQISVNEVNGVFPQTIVRFIEGPIFTEENGLYLHFNREAANFSGAVNSLSNYTIGNEVLMSTFNNTRKEVWNPHIISFSFATGTRMLFRAASNPVGPATITHETAHIVHQTQATPAQENAIRAVYDMYYTLGDTPVNKESENDYEFFAVAVANYFGYDNGTLSGTRTVHTTYPEIVPIIEELLNIN